MKTVLSLSESIIETDYRVIRQCNALQENGFQVSAYGLQANNENLNKNLIKFKILKSKKFIDPTANSFKTLTFKYKIRRILREIKNHVELLFCKAIKRKAWERIYWNKKRYRFYYSNIQNQEKDLYIINDWQFLPIGVRLAKKYNAKIIYDSHEHATSQASHKKLWRFLHAPYIRKIEKSCLAEIDFITSVSSGIIEKLVNDYDLDCPHEVIKSTPYFTATSAKTEVNPNNIKLYYHGYFKENRNLALILEALALLPSNYTLTYRGSHHSSLAYEDKLRALAKSLNVNNRFSIEEMVDQNKMFHLASQMDIGIFISPMESVQTDMVLPNKFFEYIMAGLCLCVSPAREMKEHIDKYKIGFCTPQNLNARNIANSILAISPEEISKHKKKSLEVAHVLCWEKESLKLINLTKDLLS